MGLFNSITNLFKKKEATTQTLLTPTTKSIVITDYTTGESKKTETTTTPTGITTTEVTHRGRSNSITSTQDPGGFSGKVEELSPTGETVNTSYYYGNQEIGRLSGGEYTTTTGSNINYSLGFNRGANQENVSLSSKELTIQQSTLSYSQAQPLNQDYGFSLYKGNQSTSGLNTEMGKISLGFDKYIITSGSPVVQEFGVPIVTQAEATKYGIDPNKSAVWVLSSTDKDKAIQEFAYAATTPTTTRPFKTKDLVISNIANIKAGQEIWRIGSTGGQVDTQTIYSKAVIDTRTQYKTRPFGERAVLYGAGVVQGAAAIGIKTTEFVTSASFTLSKGGPVDFKFGGTLGQLSNYPIARSTTFLAKPGTYIRESLSSPNVVTNIAAVGVATTSLVRRAAKVGTYEAVAETASFFSPIRIKPGVYATNVATTEFSNIKSFKYTNEAGVTSRAFSGSSGFTKVYGSEKFIQSGNQVIGGGTVITKTPFTEIRAGGAIVRTGVRSTFQPYTFSNLRVGSASLVKTGNFFNQVSPSIPGATTRVLTSKGMTSYDYYGGGSTIYTDFYRGYSTTSGGVTSTGETAVKSFASGRAQPYYSKTVYSETFTLKKGKVSEDFIYAPTGKYKVTPQFAGKEFNLNTLFGGQDKGYTVFKGGGSQVTKTSLSSTFAAPQVSSQRLQTSVKTTSSPILPGFTKTSQSPNLKVNQAQTNFLTSSTITAPLVFTSSAEQTRSRSRSRSITVPTFTSSLFTSPATDTAFKSNFMQGSRLSFITAQSQSYKSSLVIPAITTSSFYFNPGPTRPGPTGFIPLLDFGGGSALSSNLLQGGKSVTGYTPSFSALAFNLKGTYTGGGAVSKSGIDFRPITPGFKFNTGLGNGFTKLRKFFRI